jgi:hypothetical protein
MSAHQVERPVPEPEPGKLGCHTFFPSCFYSFLASRRSYNTCRSKGQASVGAVAECTVGWSRGGHGRTGQGRARLGKRRRDDRERRHRDGIHSLGGDDPLGRCCSVSSPPNATVITCRGRSTLSVGLGLFSSSFALRSIMVEDYWGGRGVCVGGPVHHDYCALRFASSDLRCRRGRCVFVVWRGW